MAILSIPCAHPYVQSVQPRGGWTFTHFLPDPLVDPDNPSRWWPHPAFEEQWWVDRECDVEAERVDVVHVHFGFEHLTLQQTRTFIAILRARRIPLVITVHDIDNPHVVDQRSFHAQLRILLDDAARILTLTQAARERLRVDFHVDPQRVEVVPHGQIVRQPTEIRASGLRTDVGIFLKSVRANVSQDPDFYLGIGQRCADVGRRLSVFMHRDQESSVLFHVLSESPVVDVVIHDPLSDADLFSTVAQCSAIVLPYVRGTHSGWLEMCRDLSVPVALPDCGCYADQLDTPDGGRQYRAGDYESAAIAALSLVSAGPVPCVADRSAESEFVHSIHESIYRELSSPKLNIALIAPGRFPIVQPFPGGLEAFCAMLMGVYRHFGHRVDLYAAAGSVGHQREWEFPGVDWTGYERFRTDHTYPPGEQAKEDVAFHDVIKHIEHQVKAGYYDVVHNNSLHPAPFQTESILPMLTTLHTPAIERMRESINQAITDRGLEGAGIFAAVSCAAASTWKVSVGPRIVPNGFDEDVWQWGAGGSRAVWFGRVVPEKGLHYAIDAARELGLELTIAGRIGNEEYYDKEIKPRLGPDTVWIGEASQADLARIVGNSRLCLVTPVWDEPFGLVVIESLACGTPVAALARGGITEILADFPEMLADPRHPVDGLVHAARHSMKGDRKVLAEWAQSHFGGQKLAEAYTAILHTVVADTKVPQ